MRISEEVNHRIVLNDDDDCVLCFDVHSVAASQIFLAMPNIAVVYRSNSSSITSGVTKIQILKKSNVSPMEKKSR